MLYEVGITRIAWVVGPGIQNRVTVRETRRDVDVVIGAVTKLKFADFRRGTREPDDVAYPEIVLECLLDFRFRFAGVTVVIDDRTARCNQAATAVDLDCSALGNDGRDKQRQLENLADSAWDMPFDFTPLRVTAPAVEVPVG